MARPVFPTTPRAQGMYESFYLRAVSPHEPLGAWIRYTVHKRPGAAPRGSVWCTVFDAACGAPFMHKLTSDELSSADDAWIQVNAGCKPASAGHRTAVNDGICRIGPGIAEGCCGSARWSLRFHSHEAPLLHLKPAWMYRSPLPRTKLTSPLPAASFHGTIELPHRTIELAGWHGTVGHNWGSEHAERWIWLHGVDFEQDRSAWIDVALGRLLLAGRRTPWLASGALSIAGRRIALGGLAARGVEAFESVERCSLVLPGRRGMRVEAHLDVPQGTAAGWRYADPCPRGDTAGTGEHDVVNCSIASLTLKVHPQGQSGTVLNTRHGAAYELGMQERDHGVPLAPFADG